MLLSKNEYQAFYLFIYFKLIIECDVPIPLHAKAVTKVVNPTSTSSHYNRSSDYDIHILSFVIVEAKECIEHVSDKEEEGMDNDRGSH